jgi:hypothetical protein
MAGSQVAFDQRFTAGVNLIDGENSSGKSTLFKLIYHGLGGAIAPHQWTGAALRCDRVITELGFGDAILTTVRRIEERPSLPVAVYAGDMASAISGTSVDDWVEYPYSRSDNKQSFSQFMFAMMHWNEAFSEAGDFVTLNQFLRAHYADQDSPNTTVLRFEDQFDKPTTRESIGNFLLGGNDPRLGQLERELRELEAEYSKVSGAASAGVQLIGGEFDELNLPALHARRDKIEAELAALDAFSTALMQEALRPIGRDDVDRTRLTATTQSISALKRKISEEHARIAQLKYEIDDSDIFISTLSNRIRYITEASSAAGEFGSISLDFCPACGTGVTDEGDHVHCYLCKAEMGEEPAERRLFSMINSSQGQIEQSRRLQKARRANLEKASEKVGELERALDALAVELEQQHVSVVSSAQAELAAAQSRTGFLRSELERLRRDQTIIERLQGLRDRRDALNARILVLREEIESVRIGSSTRVANAYTRVSAEALKFLRSDIERQQGFHDADSVEIDYRANRFRLNSNSSLSASSTAYLRNAIFLGELFAAASVPTMRHLGILMLENLEDKGMEPERYYNLHHSIVGRAQDLEDRQILIATADWAPDLESGFTRVGERFTHERKTLDLPPLL